MRTNEHTYKCTVNILASLNMLNVLSALFELVNMEQHCSVLQLQLREIDPFI